MKSKQGFTRRKDATGQPLEASKGALFPATASENALAKREAVMKAWFGDDLDTMTTIELAVS